MTSCVIKLYNRYVNDSFGSRKDFDEISNGNVNCFCTLNQFWKSDKTQDDPDCWTKSLRIDIERHILNKWAWHSMFVKSKVWSYMTVPPRLSSESSMDLVSTLLLWSVTFDMDDSVFSSKRRRKKKRKRWKKNKNKKRRKKNVNLILFLNLNEWENTQGIETDY